MQQKCPICNEPIQFSATKEINCQNCNCTIVLNDKELEVVKSGIGINIFNLILSLIALAGFIYILLEISQEKIRILYAGFIFTVFPFAILLRGFILKHKNDYYSLLGLYKALYKKTIAYYDLASKLLIFSIFTIQFLGIFMILFGLLFKA